MRRKTFFSFLMVAVAGLLLLTAGSREIQPASAGPEVTVYLSPT